MAELSSSLFSEIDDSNNAPSPSGFPEGMNMSGLNDSARAVMGATKRFWGRIQGVYASTGSANAYVLAPVTPLGAYVTGERYSFRANFASTGSATLNISGLGTKALKKMTASGKADLASGDIQSGQPVTVEYDGADMVMVTPAANSMLPAPGTSGNILVSDGTNWTSAAGSAPTGSISPYAGITEPTGWVFCFGQAISRTAFATLFAAISISQNGTRTSGSAIITGLSNTSNMAAGMPVSGADIPASTTIASVNSSTQITLSKNVTNSGTSAIVVAPHGVGDGSTTFNVPDLRGRVVAGRDNMGGSAANRVTTGGSGVNGATLGAAGGAETHTLTIAQMPSHAHSGAVSIQAVGSGGQAVGTTGISFELVPSNTGSAGGGQAHPNLQPTMMLNYIVKV